MITPLWEIFQMSYRFWKIQTFVKRIRELGVFIGYLFSFQEINNQDRIIFTFLSIQLFNLLIPEAKRKFSIK